MSTEQSLRRERQKLVLAPPEHWTPGAGSTGKLSLVKVRDVGVLAALQELLNGTGIGDGGRDQQQPGSYSRLELAAAWRVENHDLYCAYKVAQRKVLSFAAKVAVRGDTKVRIRNELYGSASKLPGDLETGCNEVRLLHGTKPGAFLCLLPLFESPTFPFPVLAVSQSPLYSSCLSARYDSTDQEVCFCVLD